MEKIIDIPLILGSFVKHRWETSESLYAIDRAERCLQLTELSLCFVEYDQGGMGRPIPPPVRWPIPPRVGHLKYNDENSGRA